MKAMDLFEAYAQSKLPMDEGYIVSSFFKEDSSYSIYEVVSYSAVKDIYSTSDSLTFQTNGKKIFILVEPPSYHQKTVEPYCRTKEYMVPFRFSEAHNVTAKNQMNIYYSKEPQEAISAFTVFKPEGINFAFLFYVREDIADSLEIFFAKTLNQEAGVPQIDANRTAKKLAELCVEKLAWITEK